MKSNQPLVYLACFLFLGLTSEGRADQETSLRGVPIAIYVWAIEPIDDGIGWRDIVSALGNGEQLYTPRYRDPAIKPVRVECAQTRSIGVILTVDFEGRSDRPLRPLRFDWSHKGIAAGKPQKSVYEKPLGDSFLKYRYNNQPIYWSTLSLNSKRRVNGRWRVDAYHLGDHVYTREILLEDCDRPFTPREFRTEQGPSPLYQLNPPLHVATYLADTPGAPPPKPLPSPGSTVVAEATGAPPVELEQTDPIEAAAEPAAEPANAAADEAAVEKPIDVALIAEIDATINEIDAALDRYIREYLDDLGIGESEFRDIERKLERRVKRERRAYPDTYAAVPENIHMIQTKIRFLQPVHEGFADGKYPDSLKAQFRKLAELEARL